MRALTLLALIQTGVSACAADSDRGQDTETSIFTDDGETTTTSMETTSMTTTVETTSTTTSDTTTESVEPGELAGVRAGRTSTCALLTDGKVKCWGGNGNGQLGLGDTRSRGTKPNELGANLQPLGLFGAGEKAVDLRIGNGACIVSDLGKLFCWGANDSGQLGNANSNAFGDDAGETIATLKPVPVGYLWQLQAVTLGAAHTCAFDIEGRLKCWGVNGSGQLGRGSRTGVGSHPNEMGDFLDPIDLGSFGAVAGVSAGNDHTCALTTAGEVVCWGKNDAGQLCRGTTETIGDEPGEMGDKLVAVPLPVPAVKIVSGLQHTCALGNAGGVYCWGSGKYGRLGRGSESNFGDLPEHVVSDLAPLRFPNDRKVQDIAAGDEHTCVLFEDNSVGCWGRNTLGQLGHGTKTDFGDEPSETTKTLPLVELGTDRLALGVAAGQLHSCAYLDDISVRCWGYNGTGQLGLESDVQSIGDEPGEMGDALQAAHIF